MRYFRVLYNFTAEDEVEVAVKKGEVVTPVDGDVLNGWIKVEVFGDARRRGFVPLNFLREITHPTDSDNVSPPSQATATTPMPGHSPAIPREAPSSFTSAALDYGETLHHMYRSGTRESSKASRRGGSAQQQTQRSPSYVPATARTTTTAAAAIPTQKREEHEHRLISSLPPDPATGRSLLNDPNAVIEAFMKNELHFKQLVRQRQDALAQMRSTLEGAIVDMEACRDKNATLARKLSELDQSIEKERKRWKDRIEEEKSYIARSMPKE